MKTGKVFNLPKENVIQIKILEFGTVVFFLIHYLKETVSLCAIVSILLFRENCY